MSLSEATFSDKTQFLLTFVRFSQENMAIVKAVAGTDRFTACYRSRGKPRIAAVPDATNHRNNPDIDKTRDGPVRRKSEYAIHNQKGAVANGLRELVEKDEAEKCA